MHAFVTAVFLGMARFEALDANAQAQPPDYGRLRMAAFKRAQRKRGC
jgi:hypothetical protein